MDSNTLSNILNALICIASLSIAVRAFVLYAQLHSPRLCVLGLAMSVVALTAAADTVSGIVTSVSLNTDWFLYIGQAVSLGFILLSLFCKTDRSLRQVLLWQTTAIGPVAVFLLLSPILPDFPSHSIQAILNGSRFVICIFIAGRYSYSYVFTKKTVFSFLMSATFLVLGIGYFLILPKIFFAHMEVLDQVADMIRIGGFMLLSLAFIRG